MGLLDTSNAQLYHGLRNLPVQEVLWIRRQMWKNKIKQIFILNDEVYFGNMVIYKLDSDGNTLLVKIVFKKYFGFVVLVRRVAPYSLYPNRSPTEKHCTYFSSPPKHLPQFNKGSYGTTNVPMFFNMKGLCYLAGNICDKLQISLYFWV